MHAIDCWVNVKGLSSSQLIEIMDRASVERAILPLRADGPNREIIEFADRHPDRFALAATVDPRRGMRTVSELERLVPQHPIVAVQVAPSVIDLPPNDRAYYPLYAKCCELALPILINTGFPGSLLPAKCQDPIHLDDVCLFFPDLTIVMANGADPWWSVAIRLMLKYPRLHLLTSAYAPKYLPLELIHYMNTRGGDKILFGTHYPFLTMERCLAEAQALDLRDGVLDRYLYGNAKRVFFGSAEAARAE